MAIIIVLLIAAGIGVYGYVRYQQHQTAMWRESGITDIDQMSGVDFEQRLAVLFRDQGYRVELTPRSGDYGADLIVSNTEVRIIVQAKRSARTIGVKAVQEVASALQFYGGTQAMVITNAQFSPNAYTMAERLKIVLWDRTILIQQLAMTSATPSLTSLPDDRPIDESWEIALRVLITLQFPQEIWRNHHILWTVPSDSEVPPSLTTATILRMDATLHLIDGEANAFYSASRFIGAQDLQTYIQEIPAGGLFWIFGVEKWNVAMLQMGVLPWRPDVAVIAASIDPQRLNPSFRAQFDFEMSRELAQNSSKKG